MSTTEPAPVTVIIPNYNGEDLLRRNLPAVVQAAAAYPGDCRVLVVDDGSRDGSLAVLAQFDSVESIRHPVNRGFAEAIHTGVQAADTEYLVLLNSDVAPDTDFLEPLLHALTAADVFAASPLVFEENGRVSPVSWRGYTFKRGKFKAVTEPYAAAFPRLPRHSLFASGGSVAVKKTLFLELGGFLALFKPFYSEDFDLGLRAWRRGWRTVLEPASRVVHQERGSIASHISRKRVRQIRTRNWFMLEWLHVSRRDLCRHFIPRYCTQAVGRLLRLDHVYFRGLAGALWHLPEVLSWRKTIAAQSSHSLAEVMATINAQLNS